MHLIAGVCLQGLAYLGLALLFASSAIAAGKPQLVLDTGGHMGLVRAMVFTPDGKRIVSAGDDKVIRIWDIASGRTERTIRGYAGSGNEGKIYALALSPDGKTIAVGGWLGPFSKGGDRAEQPAHWVRLHDFETGAVKGLLKRHRDIVNALSFSPDGRSLISASADKTAIIWDVQSATLRYRLDGHGAFVSAAAFSPDGSRAITGSFDRTLRIWDAVTGTLMAALDGHAQPVRSLAVSKNGAIASGDLAGEIRLWTSETAIPLRTLLKQGGDVPALSFSPDGASLLAGRGPGKDYAVSVYNAEGGAVRSTFKGHDGVVLATAFSPDGKIAATAGGTDYAIALWNPQTGALIKKLAGAGTTFASTGFAADGSAIAWGTEFNRDSPFGRGDYAFELKLPAEEGRFLNTPQPLSGAPGAYLHATGSQGVWTLTQSAGRPLGYGDAVLEVRRNGEVYGRVERTSSDGYRHRAYTLTPDGTQIISGGGNGVLAAYSLEGKKLGDFIGHEGEIWSLTVSADGKLLVSGSSDQTMKLWNVETRELILTVFQGQDGNWIAWTPQGYYTSSPGGDRAKAWAVGWLVSKGVGELSDYIQAGELQQQLFRPDVVTQAIRLASAKKAIGESEDADFKSDDLNTRRPPRFAVLEPSDGQQISANTASVRIELQDLSTPLTDLSVIVNAAQITGGGTRGLERIRDGGAIREVEIPLDQYENRIQIRAANGIGQFFKELILYNPALKDKKDESKPKGKLYLLAIGVDTYENRPQKDQLRYAAADAKAFRDAMTKSAAGLYSEVVSQVIATGGDKPPTRANIVDALDVFFTDVTKDDTAVLFLAGHGVNQGKDYFFMPEDADSQDGRWRPSTAVRWYDIQRPLESAGGKRVMFVDTCHSQQAFNPRFMNEASDARMVVFSATDAETLAIEDPSLGHGIFTHALLEGVKGNADFGNDGVVNIFELNLFVSQDVAKRTKDKQRPAFHNAGTDFAFAAK